MNTSKKIIVALLVCLSISLMFNFCPRQTAPVVNTEYKYLHDTVHHTMVLSTPVPYVTTLPADTVIQTVPYIDSAYCKQLAIRYYSRNVYRQTLVDDSILTASLLDTVSENRLLNRKFEFKINRPQTVIVNTMQPAEKQSIRLFVGATVTKLPANYSVGPSVMLSLRKSALTYTYDFVNRYHQMTYFFKIVGK
jgi:hypothetical protein